MVTAASVAPRKDRVEELRSHWIQIPKIPLHISPGSSWTRTSPCCSTALLLWALPKISLKKEPTPLQSSLRVWSAADTTGWLLLLLHLHFLRAENIIFLSNSSNSCRIYPASSSQLSQGSSKPTGLSLFCSHQTQCPGDCCSSSPAGLEQRSSLSSTLQCSGSSRTT